MSMYPYLYYGHAMGLGRHVTPGGPTHGVINRKRFRESARPRTGPRAYQHSRWLGGCWVQPPALPQRHVEQDTTTKHAKHEVYEDSSGACCLWSELGHIRGDVASRSVFYDVPSAQRGFLYLHYAFGGHHSQLLEFSERLCWVVLYVLSCVLPLGCLICIHSMCGTRGACGLLNKSLHSEWVWTLAKQIISTGCLVFCMCIFLIWPDPVQGGMHFKTHPVRSRPNFMEMCIPLLLHGDGFPCSGIGKAWGKVMDSWQWSSLLSNAKSKWSVFLAWCVHQVLRSTQDGFGTLDEAYKGLSWSFNAIWEGVWPSENWETPPKSLMDPKANVIVSFMGLMLFVVLHHIICLMDVFCILSIVFVCVLVWFMLARGRHCAGWRLLWVRVGAFGGSRLQEGLP